MPIARFTPEWAEKIAKEYVEKFVFAPLFCTPGCVQRYEFYDKRLFVIFISPATRTSIKSREYQLETFVHELMHVFRYIWGRRQAEMEIEKQTVRFVQQHREFVSKLFTEIVQSSKSEGEVLVDDSIGIEAQDFRPLDKKISYELERKLWRKYYSTQLSLPFE